jgi:hypothetical protein
MWTTNRPSVPDAGGYDSDDEEAEDDEEAGEGQEGAGVAALAPVVISPWLPLEMVAQELFEESPSSLRRRDAQRVHSAPRC